MNNPFAFPKPVECFSDSFLFNLRTLFFAVMRWLLSIDTWLRRERGAKSRITTGKPGLLFPVTYHLIEGREARGSAYFEMHVQVNRNYYWMGPERPESQLRIWWRNSQNLLLSTKKEWRNRHGVIAKDQFRNPPVSRFLVSFCKYWHDIRKALLARRWEAIQVFRATAHVADWEIGLCIPVSESGKKANPSLRSQLADRPML